MKKTFALLILICFAFLEINAQVSLETALTSIKSKATFDTLVYFGVDLSHVRVNDAPKISKSLEYSQVYPHAWISFIEEKLPPDGFVRKALGFPTFIYAQHEIYEKSIKVDPQFIIGSDNNIPSDTIDAVVSKYILQSKSGLGLVLIPETFSKPRETAVIWLVFFDVKSRHVLYKTKINGECSHMGYTAHWATGVVEGFKVFANN
ncbi:MAG: hypothetical protein WCK09_15530 [Bacteroidota bacterium]